MPFSNHIIYRNNEVSCSYKVQNYEMMEIFSASLLSKKGVHYEPQYCGKRKAYGLQQLFIGLLQQV